MRRTALALASAALLLSVAACGSSDGQAGSGSSAKAVDAGPHNAADATFAQEMVPHHRQAVAMVEMTKGHDLDPEVQRIVDAIGSTQSGEIDQMVGWLKGWGEKVPAEDSPMRMQGMLSSDELDQLRETGDPAFQGLWLSRMVGHHQGAIPMAQTEIDDGENPKAIRLAREIIETQKAELDEMAGLIGQ
ncbi:lipoprotein [Marmoricola endophyticus]|uniref:Lipoprotein n=1 Tax=Marmoricola endophyticus TaxID=2040280 RepID=A0A917F3T3_9ACTN|nr:DUF305 domain-containing protein [Marmoricola endophyticus]GGF45896.1 lipoprotein [Marmoricola endophyticus]